jgi:hypothetical protein
MAQVVEHPTSKHEALSSNTSAAKKNNNKWINNQQNEMKK